tara:strand:- start:554 stop:1096 length:543 start_codon:yes stop_codon:yes gene_type:complete
MGTDVIANLSASDISDLQDDVNELNTKLNALIVEFNKCSDDTTTNKGKIDRLITDVNNIETKISGNYTAGNTGSGSASDSILKRLHDLDDDIKELDDDITSFHAGRSAHRGGGSSSTSTIDLSALTATGTGTGDDTSVNATSSSVTGTYGAASSSVVTLGNKGEIKARKLARQTLNRLRK